MIRLLWVLGCAAEPEDTGPLSNAARGIDGDGDAFPARLDCDDSDPAVHIDAAEVCNGKDDDCDGLVDDDDEGVSGQRTGFVDQDGDGWGDEAWSACESPAQSSENGGDCEDGDASVSPGAPESCNGQDDDCDEIVDDACDPAPVGEFNVTESQVQVREPCAGSGAGTRVALGDIDGDGLADLLTHATCNEATRILAANAPFAPEVTLGFNDDVIVAERTDTPNYEPLYPSMIDVNIDGRDELFTREGWQDLQLFRDPRWGMFTDEADLTFHVDPPEVDPYESLWSYWGTAIPGADGGAVVIIGAWIVSDYTRNETWIADATLSGEVSTRDLGTLGPEGRDNNPAGTGGYPYDAGDLDGDGNHELLLASQELIDLYMGPLFPVTPERTPDFRFAGEYPVDGEYDGAGMVHATYGDFDADGYDELLLGTAVRNVATIDRITVTGGSLSTTLGNTMLEPSRGILAFTLSPAMDANGDGALDLAVADGSVDNGVDRAGIVCIEYGPFAGAREMCGAESAIIVGTEEAEQVGMSLAAGDTNGDGFDDLAIGSYRSYSGGGRETAFLFLGGP